MHETLSPNHCHASSGSLALALLSSVTPKNVCMEQKKPLPAYDYNILHVFTTEANRLIRKFLTVGEFNSMWCAFSRRPLHSEWRSWDGLTTRTGFFFDKWEVRMEMFQRIARIKSFDSQAFPLSCANSLYKQNIGGGEMALLKKFLLGWSDGCLTLITFPLTGVTSEVGVVASSGYGTNVTRISAKDAEEMRKLAVTPGKMASLIDRIYCMEVDGQRFEDMFVARPVRARIIPHQYLEVVQTLGYYTAEDPTPQSMHSRCLVVDSLHPKEATVADDLYTDFIDELLWAVKESKDFESNRQRALEDARSQFDDELNCCVIESERLALDKSEYDTDGEDQFIFGTDRALFAHVPVRSPEAVLADQLAFFRKLKRAAPTTAAAAAAQ